MTKLNITGLREDSEQYKPAKDGTYANIGSQGGTEMMMKGLRDRLPADLLDQFNFICSRVRPENISADKKNILWLHDTYDDPESEHLSKESSRKRFSKLIFVSNFQQATFNIGRGVPYSDGIVMPNAIVPIPEHTKPNNSVINLIYHTTPHRGLELLVPVFEYINQQIPNLHLDIFSSFKAYGWGQRDEPYKALFERCQRHPNIEYHGFQPNDVVRAALQKAHIYAYPNIWPETSCISVIEAMSAGCSVVCPNFYALPETCANFATMYPFDEDYNRHANLFARVLVNAINSFWNESNQNKLNVQKNYFDNFYNWDLRAAQWKSLLSQLVTGK
jgi:UDP-glucose:(glucosyl)LPS alpha-1,2-glucosyltransferase